MKNSCSLANDKTTTRKDATIFHVTEWPELIKGTAWANLRLIKNNINPVRGSM